MARKKQEIKNLGGEGMPYCSKCGAELEEGDVFCHTCGARVKRVPKEKLRLKPARVEKPRVLSVLIAFQIIGLFIWNLYLGVLYVQTLFFDPLGPHPTGLQVGTLLSYVSLVFFVAWGMASFKGRPKTAVLAGIVGCVLSLIAYLSIYTADFAWYCTSPTQLYSKYPPVLGGMFQAVICIIALPVRAVSIRRTAEWKKPFLSPKLWGVIGVTILVGVAGFVAIPSVSRQSAGVDIAYDAINSVPLYPGATPPESYYNTVSTSLPRWWMAAHLCSSSENIAQISKWYETQMTKKGWTKTMDNLKGWTKTMDNLDYMFYTVHFFTFTKGDAAIIMEFYPYMPNDAWHSVTISAGPKTELNVALRGRWLVE